MSNTLHRNNGNIYFKIGDVINCSEIMIEFFAKRKYYVEYQLIYLLENDKRYEIFNNCSQTYMFLRYEKLHTLITRMIKRK